MKSTPFHYRFATWRFAILLSCLAVLLSCKLSDSTKPDSLTFHLPDSLLFEAGKYDSVRLDVYSISGGDTDFVRSIFSDRYESPDQLAKLPLPEGLNGDFLIRVSAFRGGRKAFETGVPFSDGVPSKPISYPVPEGPVNRAPAFTSGLEPRSLREGETLTVVLTARDQDGDAVTFAIENLDSLRARIPDRPEAISFTSAADSFSLRFDPGAAPGKYWFRISVRDPAGAYEVQVLDLSVGRINHPPILAFVAPASGTAFRVQEGKTLSFGIKASDPDSGDRARLLALEQAPWPGCGSGAYDTVTGAFTFTPAFACVADGESTLPRLLFRAVDDGIPPEAGEMAVTLTVEDVNTAPRWAPGPVALTGKEGKPLSLDLAAYFLGDAEMDSVKISASCGVIQFQPLRWSFVPGFRDQGQKVCTLTAADFHQPPASSVLELELTIQDSARALEVDILSPTRGAAFRDSIIRVLWEVEGIPQTRDTTEKLSKEGPNLVRRSFRDSLGNEGSDTLTVILDTQAPGGPSVRSPGWTNQARPRWSWRSGGEGNGEYRVRLDTLLFDAGAINLKDTAYTAPRNLAEGRHVLYVQERDAAGNWSDVDSGIAKVDLTAPAVAFASPADGHVTNQGGVSVAWTVDGKEQPAFNQTLSEGSNAITKSVSDSAGNQGSATITVTRRSQVIFVNAAAAAGGDGNSWAKACNTLQLGLEKAAVNWEIWVAKGTYYPNAGLAADLDTSFMMKDGVSLLGGFLGREDIKTIRDWKANLTVIRGRSPVPGQENYPRKSLVFGSERGLLDGFVLENGNSFSGSALQVDLVSNMAVSNCLFRNNSGQALEGGGAIQTYGMNFSIINSEFIGNSSTTEAGAICVAGTSSATIQGCKFINNRSARPGGSIYVDIGANAVISGSYFQENVTQMAGGALAHRGSVEIKNSYFLGNSSGSNGGGIYSQLNYLALSNCVFVKNTAEGTGGAIQNFKANVFASNLTIYGNSSLAEGGAIYFEGNESDTGSVSIQNTILWGNTAPMGPEIGLSPLIKGETNFRIQYSILQGGIMAISKPDTVSWTAGPSIFTGDPKFRNTSNHAGPDGIYMTSDDGLSPNGGPAINAGTLSGAPATDVTGSSRPKNGLVDIGAYEP